MTPGPSTLFCDIGGVLIENPWTLVAKGLSNERQIGRERVFEMLLDLSRGLDKDQITLRGFHRILTDAFPMTITYGAFRRLLLYSSLRRIPSVWNSIRGLKSSTNLSILALSNMSSPVWNSLQQRYDIQSLFDYAILSYQIGVTKPDRRIFKLALDRARSRPQDCILIDDSAENIAVAKSLGFRAHRVRHPKETVRFLDSLRALPR